MCGLSVLDVVALATAMLFKCSRCYGTWPLIPGQIVHTPGDYLAEPLVGEVIHADLFGSTLRLPLTAGILEVPDQLLLLRVHRHHGLALLLGRTHLSVDMLELGIPIGV